MRKSDAGSGAQTVDQVTYDAIVCGNDTNFARAYAGKRQLTLSQQHAPRMNRTTSLTARRPPIAVPLLQYLPASLSIR